MVVKLKDGFKGERHIVLPPYVIESIKKERLSRELYITDIGYYPRAKFHFRKRSKDEVKQYVLIYCVEGEGWFSVPDRKYSVIQNQFFILPKGCDHAYGSVAKNPWTIYWLHFDGEHADFFANGLDQPTDFTVAANSRIEERIRLFEELFNTLSKGYSRNNISYVTTSLFYFLGSIKFLGEYRESIPAEENKNQLIDKVIHFMREHIGHKLTLNEMADHVGLSVSQFSLRFNEKTGYSPLRYFNHLKIQKACHYLDFTDLKVNQISPSVGFDDAFYFSRIFTNVMGVSPSGYRSRKKG